MNQIPRREVEDFTDKDLQEIYAQVEDVDVVGIDAFKDEFLQSIEEAQEAHGIPLPFPNTEDLVRLRKSEVTVLALRPHHRMRLARMAGSPTAARGTRATAVVDPTAAPWEPPVRRAPIVIRAIAFSHSALEARCARPAVRLPDAT